MVFFWMLQPVTQSIIVSFNLIPVFTIDFVIKLLLSFAHVHVNNVCYLLRLKTIITHRLLQHNQIISIVF